MSTNRITRDAIITAAFEAVCQRGSSALTMEELCSSLECTREEIETYYTTTEELLSIVEQKAREHYNSYVEKGFAMNPPFKGYGIEHIWFSMDEPHLYSLLFIEKKFSTIDELLHFEGHYDRALKCIMDTFSLDENTAKELYRNLWLVEHAITNFFVDGTIRMTISEAAAYLGKFIRALLLEIKAGTDAREGFVPGQGVGPSGTVSDYIDSGMAEVRRRQNAALLEGLISQNRILKQLHDNARYVKDSEWIDLMRLVEAGFGISQKNLISRYPFLSTSDFRLIILCRLGFGTGASSTILGISPASVTKARQRLKAKVQYDSVEEFVATL